MTYWPWWAGALGLAAVTINHTLTTDRSFGVASSWDRVLHWRSERRIERMDAEFANLHELEVALVAATAAYADQVVGDAQLTHDTADSSLVQPPFEVAPTASDAPPLRLAPVASQAALLASIFVGGLIAAISSGRFQIRYDMGASFRHSVTANTIVMVCVLFAGGILVGFGTRLCGGCSSGHGLSGCGRLRPVSLVATAVFFGTAVTVSTLLWRVI